MATMEAPPFNVTSTDAQRFRSFIDDLRKMLRVPDRPVVMEGAARLPPQVDNPQLMHLTLRATNDEEAVRQPRQQRPTAAAARARGRLHVGPTRGRAAVGRQTNAAEVVLAMRTDNLFVIGFRNAAGRWYELKHGNGRAAMINGSIALDFNGSYQGGLSTLDERQAIGPNIVAEAINGLADYNGGDTSRIKRWLRSLIVNFVESIRLNTIADRVDILMRNPDIGDQQLSTQNVCLIKDWGALSTALIIAANNTQGTPFRNFDKIGISTVVAAAMELGMVLIERP